jgi:hypothetical protein
VRQATGGVARGTWRVGTAGPAARLVDFDYSVGIHLKIFVCGGGDLELLCSMRCTHMQRIFPI